MRPDAVCPLPPQPRPYANGTFDSEFTATKDQLTGRKYPHQKELRVALGLVSYPGSVLEEVRLAGLFKNDFSLPRGQAEGGLLAGFKLAIPLWKAALKLGTALRYFPRTDDDTVEDLGLILESRALVRSSVEAVSATPRSHRGYFTFSQAIRTGWPADLTLATFKA